MQKRIPFQAFFNIVILLCTFSLSVSLAAGPGKYLVTLTVDGEVMKTTLIIEKDNSGYMER